MEVIVEDDDLDDIQYATEGEEEEEEEEEIEAKAEQQHNCHQQMELEIAQVDCPSQSLDRPEKPVNKVSINCIGFSYNVCIKYYLFIYFFLKTNCINNNIKFYRLIYSVDMIQVLSILWQFGLL